VAFHHLLQNQWDNVITLDLVTCNVCGEPLYTVDYIEGLQENLKETVEALCSKHKRMTAASPWQRIAPGKSIHGDKQS
jgi:ferredoxin hydrogenase large subunit